MPLLVVPANTWTTVETTSADVVIQNRGATPVYITTEATGGLDRDEGWEIDSGDFITVGSGMSVKVNATNPGIIYYGDITTGA